MKDYTELLKKRLPKEVNYDELLQLSLPLQKRYIAEEDFGTKCIYAIELAWNGFSNAETVAWERILRRERLQDQASQ